MIKPVTGDEVRHVVFDIEDEKAPGLDGYTVAFFKKAWEVVGEEITIAVQQFFSSGKLLKQLNSTLITLVPKVQLPQSMADFRPISCCTVLYKIISKVMVNRMKVSLQQLVHFSQNAFIPGRKITENILLAQELLSGYNQSHLPKRCAMKIDLRKAYDTVAWDFVLAAMIQFGFHTTFVNWIMECITTPTYSISINGGPQGFFPATRGLRQGDPLSPYLFVLVMECLHAMIQFHIHQDGAFAFRWKCENLNLCMLSFADDILLFCRAEEHTIILLTYVIQEFADMSGLHANPSKTQCFLSRSAAELTEEVLNLTGFQLGHL
ncbi:putative mitochondrial protein [Sesamum angolense]|uniref:Mitochondrial protein n=1 Tax=Sesamum angolense TaxID=2727404 RepID=A0AAE1T7C6_9LAMI|nr:putative mitochondrial protein [Sesamum angolense]